MNRLEAFRFVCRCLAGPICPGQTNEILRKEIDRRLNAAGYRFEWADIKQDLKALQQVMIEENGKRLVIRSQSKGVCGKVFQAVGVAMPPTIKEL